MGKVKISLTKKQMETIVNGLQGISHPVRLGIVYLLLTEELSVNEISSYLHISQSVTSQHLSKLKEVGILDSRKEANKVFYYIKNPRYKTLIESILKFYEDSEKSNNKKL